VKPAGLSVLCIPAADESDEIIAVMLTKLLSRDGFKADTLSPSSSVADKMAELGKREVDIVVISALPPGALVPARHLYKKIRNAHPTLDVLVGLWSQGVSAEELQERFGAHENTRFATTIAEARNQVTQRAAGLALRKTPAAPEPSLQSAP
jgi:methylmalonyl-CoA mutase cobalamin-binding subunit